MSMHKIPLTQIEEDGLRAHGLDIGTPSQLSDAFRHGVAWALKAGQGEAVAFAQGNLVDIFEDSTVSVIRREADDSYTLPLYLAPPASADAVSMSQLDRHALGQAVSDWLTENDPNGLDWCDARNVDALIDALLARQEVKP